LQRKDIARKSLESYGAVVVMDSISKQSADQRSLRHLEIFSIFHIDSHKIRTPIYFAEITRPGCRGLFHGSNHVLPPRPRFSPLGGHLAQNGIIRYTKEELSRT
jgi:histidinol dehydrogenase